MLKNIIFCCLVLALFAGTVRGFAAVLKYDPVETESMLFLFNKTPIKGSDVEYFAPLQVKLRKALEKARAAGENSEKEIEIELMPNEILILIRILEMADFEAKYAELVANMKKKLQDLADKNPAPIR
ncbi:hypothetical protein JW935_08040 [candidate division KSB1 bacterium]|nr:hypothetical protein [candidate division KSB1 bacterium]